MANFGGNTGLLSGFDTSFLSGLLNFSINLLALIVVIALIFAAVMYIKKTLLPFLDLRLPNKVLGYY